MSPAEFAEAAVQSLSGAVEGSDEETRLAVVAYWRGVASELGIRNPPADERRLIVFWERLAHGLRVTL